MPIRPIDAQRGLAEIGRIRMGDQKPTAGGGSRPNKLTRFRLTSQRRKALEAAAALYGGVVQPWTHNGLNEFELYIEVDALPCIICPGMPMQYFEEWDRGGCKHRCDGEYDEITQGPCQCSKDPKKRKCKPTTRFWVYLHQIPGLGRWRLETHGYYGAKELPAYAEALQELAARGHRVEVALRIDQRSSVSEGKTKHYPVPVVDCDLTLSEIMAQAGLLMGPGAQQTAIGPGLAAVPALPPASAVVGEWDDDEDDEADGGPVPVGGAAIEAPVIPVRSVEPDASGPCPECHAPAGKPHATRCKLRGDA